MNLTKFCKGITYKADNKMPMSPEKPSDMEPRQPVGFRQRVMDVLGSLFAPENSWSEEQLARQVQWRIRRAYRGERSPDESVGTTSADQPTSQPETLAAFLDRYAAAAIKRTYR